jgi:hypothetical protein
MRFGYRKTNGSMGSFYRSKHELVFVFKVGTAPHVNSFGLGDTGRYRTNVWDYPGVSSMGAGRMEDLAKHQRHSGFIISMSMPSKPRWRG